MNQHSTNGLPAPSPRRRIASYANVTATVALFFALAGGTAWATNHYLISSTKQIKPSVLKTLHGANGTNGTNGAVGATGATGVAGNVGPQGPGANVLTATLTAGPTSTQTSSVGAIPVFFACIKQAGDPEAWLETTATTGGSGLDTFGGNYYASYSDGAPDNYDNNPPEVQWNDALGAEDYLATTSSDSDTAVGSVLISSYDDVDLFDTTTTETINFGISSSGTGATATCTIDAQIVSGSESSHLVL